jgi:hypothetical protein
MHLLLYRWTGKDRESTTDSDDVVRARIRYGFDQPTAQRLAFIRWLWQRGRLSEG